ncbi:MAG: hypothetical protein JW892_06615 [Anaerolineae bacterium]|nr:hypothetical protein [Anaerolineae bacterium]
MTETPASSGSAFWRAVGAFFKFMLRLIFVIVLGLLIGAGLYFGVPWVYRTFVRPVQENTARITALEQRVTQEQARAKTDLQNFEERLTTLETALQDAREETANRDEALASQTAALDEATTRVTTLEADLLDVEADVKAQGELLVDLKAELELLQELVEGKDVTVNQQVGVLEGRVALLQTAQDLLRVRLLLLEEDPRAAAEATTLAIAHLEQARTLLPDSEPVIAALQSRLQELRALIDERSFRVGLELEALWAEVMELVLPAAAVEVTLPELPPEVTPGLSPVPTPPAP